MLNTVTNVYTRNNPNSDLKKSAQWLVGLAAATVGVEALDEALQAYSIFIDTELPITLDTVEELINKVLL